ncbi:NfeD family protein [Bacillus suaedaesalsae]|uniref:Nodulation protein NfeD n=1 Tax=Bacillus suaedaesalsae TaxID=2810349 RepID=A0ABS2DI79_9BACI|nr:NfeD family protein [Bacillus suaedaesalsae]MBM6617233.1 nodulation protein NfeD [Bacillus suaedaesalsae]
MDLLMIPSVGFFVLLLATLFLVGEMLVKTRGLFGVLGLALITSYFIFHNTGEHLIWIVGLYVGGLLLVFLDGKFINDGTVAIIGVIMMVAAVVIPAPSIVYGILSGAGLIIGGLLSPLFLKVFRSREMWSKVALKDRLTSEEGYNSINSSYDSLVGRTGKTITPFRPVGTIEIDGKLYSAVSDGEWIETGVEVVVDKVDGTKILIKRVEE